MVASRCATWRCREPVYSRRHAKEAGRRGIKLAPPRLSEHRTLWCRRLVGGHPSASNNIEQAGEKMELRRPSACAPAQRQSDLSEIPIIAVIDDDEAVRHAIRELVRALGYNVSTFASADEFLKSWLKTHCALLPMCKCRGWAALPARPPYRPRSPHSYHFHYWSSWRWRASTGHEGRSNRLHGKALQCRTLDWLSRHGFDGFLRARAVTNARRTCVSLIPAWIDQAMRGPKAASPRSGWKLGIGRLQLAYRINREIACGNSLEKQRRIFWAAFQAIALCRLIRSPRRRVRGVAAGFQYWVLWLSWGWLPIRIWWPAW